MHIKTGSCGNHIAGSISSTQPFIGDVDRRQVMFSEGVPTTSQMTGNRQLLSGNPTSTRTFIERMKQVINFDVGYPILTLHERYQNIPMSRRLTFFIVIRNKFLIGKHNTVSVCRKFEVQLLSVRFTYIFGQFFCFVFFRWHERTIVTCTIFLFLDIPWMSILC